MSNIWIAAAPIVPYARLGSLVFSTDHPGYHMHLKKFYILFPLPDSHSELAEYFFLELLSDLALVPDFL